TPFSLEAFQWRKRLSYWVTKGRRCRQFSSMCLPDQVLVYGDCAVIPDPDVETLADIAVQIGPMLQGMKKPVNDLSRGALVDDIVYTIALTAIQATQSI